jgi:hypothetical protein
MALKAPTILTPAKGVMIAKWTLANGDNGSPLIAPAYDWRSVQVYGTFGTNGSVQIEGSDEAPASQSNQSPTAPTWAVVHTWESNGANAVFTANSVAEILDSMTQYRPNCTNGNGSTALSVIMTLRSGRV